MKLVSPAFSAGGEIPSIHTCDGSGVSPELRISDVPADARSLALIMHDPDSKTDWIHWTIWNIDPGTSVIPEGVVSAGTSQGLNDFGVEGYGGPCPQVGRHRYVFELFALDATLTLVPGADAKTLHAALEGRTLVMTTLMGTYLRHLNVTTSIRYPGI
ncbi:MAG: YbhB/YbcL family Raf kinase inhibitor-like protein [Patescibacteria group bacterium]